MRAYISYKDKEYKKNDEIENENFNDNCFSFIRFICAFQVFYMHAIEAFGIESNYLVSSILSMFRGVPIFFALSGYLMWHSITCETNRSTYIKKRFIRLYPELWLVVILSVFMIVPFIKIDWSQFLLWIFGQATLFQFWTPDFLRAYGVGTPNGSLWTITIFAQFYLLVFFLKKYYLKKGKSNCIVLLPIMGLMVNLIWIFLLRNNVPLIIDKIYRVTIIPYIWIFGIGIVICEYRNYIIPLLKRYFYVLSFILFAIIFFNIRDFDVENYYLMRTVLSLSIIFGMAYKFRGFTIKNDYSYELYLVHMVIVNLFISLGLTKEWSYFVLSFFLSVITAILIFKLNAYLLKRIPKK